MHIDDCEINLKMWTISCQMICFEHIIVDKYGHVIVYLFKLVWIYVLKYLSKLLNNFYWNHCT